MNPVFYVVYILALCAVATYLNSREPTAFIGFVLGLGFGASAVVIELIKDVN